MKGLAEETLYYLSFTLRTKYTKMTDEEFEEYSTKHADLKHWYHNLDRQSFKEVAALNQSQLHAIQQHMRPTQQAQTISSLFLACSGIARNDGAQWNEVRFHMNKASFLAQAQRPDFKHVDVEKIKRIAQTFTDRKELHPHHLIGQQYIVTAFATALWQVAKAVKAAEDSQNEVTEKFTINLTDLIDDAQDIKRICYVLSL